MTHKERFAAALRRESVEGQVPTFELVFFLTMEALRKVHPRDRRYNLWSQMSPKERQLQRNDIADVYLSTAKKYGHDCIQCNNYINYAGDEFEETVRLLETLRERGGDQYFVVMHGDPTFEIPNGNDMTDFSARFFEEPEAMAKIARERLEASIKRAERLSARKGLLDGFIMCSDYCFNTNPFFSPSMFSEFVAPYLKRICDEYRAMGYYTIKHTDGNIMPIIDQIVACGPDALHSLDPQGGVDLAEVKRLYGDRVALCGNVNCGLLQTGTEEEIVADVRRALREGMQGWGYIFCTSNCVYTGLDLSRYEMMMDIWQREGNYRLRPISNRP